MSKTRVVGLDIGSTAIRAVEVEFGSQGPARTASPKVVRVAERPLPNGAIRDGEVQEPALVSTLLKQMWRDSKFSTKDVVIGVGSQRVLVRDLEVPAMPLAQIRASLPYQVQEFLPIAVEDAHLDFLPTETGQGQHGPLVKGLLVAATRDTVEANLRAVEMAGLRAMMVDLTAFALTRSIVRGPLMDKTLALVDLGARITTVVVVSRGVPKFVRVLPTGGQDMTDAVSNAMGIPVEQAEALKCQLGLGQNVPPEYGPAADAISEVAHVLVEAVRSTLSYFASSTHGSIDGVLLSGRGARLAGLGQYIATSARVGVTMARPLSTMTVGPDVPRGEAIEELESVLSVSLGLAFGEAA